MLTFQSYLNKSTTPALDGAQDVCVSPDNKHVYVVGYNKDGISAFSRDAAGDLTFIHALQDTSQGGSVPNMNTPRGVKCSPDGNNVYVCCSNSDSVVCFDRNATTGELTYNSSVKDNQGGVSGLNSARQMAISDNGNYLFCVASSSDAVAVFSRGATGELTFLNKYEQEIDGPYNLCISPDQAYVYIGSSGNDRIVAYTFNDATGGLTFHSVVQNNENGVSGLDSVRGLAMSPDNQYLYACGRNSDAVVVLSRGADGYLSFVASYVDTGKGGSNDDLNSAQHVAITADGAYVLVTSYFSDALIVFGRNAADGTLTDDESYSDGEGGVNGMNGTRGLAIAPDQKNVYVTGRVDDAVVTFGGPES